MVDIFQQEKIKFEKQTQAVDIFAREGITPPTIGEINKSALNNTLDISKESADNVEIKKDVEQELGDIEKLARARFSEEQLNEWRNKPITFAESYDFLELSDVLPLGGVKKAKDVFNVKNIAERINAGEPVTKAQQETLDNFINKTIEMHVRGFSFGGGVNYYGSQMPAFMTEFALTGGIGKGAQAVAVKGLTKIATTSALKATTKAVGIAANVTARTAAMPGMYIPKYAERRLNDSMAITDRGEVILKESKESPAVSALKSFAYTGAEVASELSGAAITNKIINPVTNKLKTPLVAGINALPVKLKQGLYEAYKTIKPNASVSRVFTAGGWNGMLAELGEERVADVLRESLALSLEDGYTIDDVLDGITPSKEQLQIEAGIIAIAGGMKSSSSAVMNILQKKGMSPIESQEAVNNMSVEEQEGLIESSLQIERKQEGASVKVDSAIAAQIDAKVSSEPPSIDSDESTFNRFYRDWFNNLAPVESLTKEAIGKGVEITPGNNPKLLARTYAGVIGMARQNLQVETYIINKDGNVEVTGKGLKPILDDFDNSIMQIEPDRTIREKDFREYLIARRYQEDLQDREDVEVTEEQLKYSAETMTSLAAKYADNFSWFDTYAREIYDFQRRILNNLVTSGNMSKEQYDEILKKNPNYIPFKRVLEQDEFKNFATSKGVFTNAASSKLIKKIRGSEKEIKDPIQSIIANTTKIIEYSQRNRVARSVANLADAMPEYIEKVKTPMQKITIDGKEVFRPSGIEPKGAISVYIDGKKKYYKVSKPLLEAMQQLQPTQLDFLQKLFSVPASVLRAGATLVPEFWVRNVLRDQTSALIQSEVRPTPVDMVKGLASVIGDGDLYNQWMKSGGSFNSYMELSDTGLEKAYKELFRPDGKLNRYMRNPLNLPADISGVLEQGTRVGVFFKAKKAGLSDLEAALQAREATLDFARGGTKSKIINRIIPFFNAGMQGTDKLIRTFKENPKATTMWASATITMPSLLLTGYYLYGAPEDEKQEFLEIPQWQKDMFWVFKEGDTWVRYPKPFTLGYVFGSVPERFLMWMDGTNKKQGEKFWNELVVGMFGAFSPVYDASALLPPLVKVGVETATNYNFFTGRDIYPAWMEDLLPEERKNKYTSETATALGKKLGVSPAVIDNALRGTLAGSAGYVTDAGDFVLNEVKKWNGEDVPEKPSSLADVPLVRAFVVRDPSGSQSESVQTFYDIFKELKQINNTFKSLDGQEKQDFRDNNDKSIAAYNTLKGFSDQVKNLNKQGGLIYDDVSMSADEKEYSLKLINDQITALAREANQWYYDNVLEVGNDR